VIVSVGVSARDGSEAKAVMTAARHAARMNFDFDIVAPHDDRVGSRPRIEL